MNQPLDVAKVIAGLWQLINIRSFDLLTSFLGAVAEPSLNGAALFVTGGRAWDIECGINELQPQWLGDENHRSMVIGQKLLGNGDSWIASHQS